MKILRTIGILALVAGLVLGGTGSVLAQGPPNKRGLFGTVSSVVTDDPGVEYTISLETELGTVDVTINGTAKYMVPKETRGPKDLTTFLGKVDTDVDGDLEELEGRRLAVLVTFTNESTADAIRLMLIPSSDTPPSHAHRVGVVEDFTSPYTSITIKDRHGVSHTFTITGAPIYRPEGTIAGDIKDYEPWSCVTVVTKGDPKLTPPLVAKAIVLHDELPDWAPEP